jgi:hypothetical protein
VGQSFPAKADRSFAVPTPVYYLMLASRRLAPALVRLAGLESRIHRRRLAEHPLDRPIFITGAARAGTTITLEMLSRHPDVATHRYSDFVVPYLPIWWDWLLPHLPLRGLEEPVERLHRDRIEVTRHSPEAIEEMVWMQFFPHLHDRTVSNVLDGGTSHPQFEYFFREHIRKLLAARGRWRYAAKNNNLAFRLSYLVRVLRDARVLLLVRNPVSHIASLMKQHRVFHEIGATEPRQMAVIEMAGHHEFGPPRICPNLGDRSKVAEIEACWRDDREARGWALWWAATYDHIDSRLQQDPAVERACHVIRYEDLCSRSEEVIRELLEHVELPLEPFRSALEEYARKLSPPDYYRHGFSREELAEIAEATRATAAKFGYPAD